MSKSRVTSCVRVGEQETRTTIEVEGNERLEYELVRQAMNREVFGDCMDPTEYFAGDPPTDGATSGSVGGTSCP